MFKIRKIAGVVVATAFAAVTSVYAAVPAPVTTAMGDAAADVATVAGLGLAVAVAVYGFKKMKGAL